MTIAEIRHQIEESIDRLSPERLRVAADFLAYLADRESYEATEELLNIPGLMESFKEARAEISK